jgi:hypothetical protein
MNWKRRWFTLDSEGNIAYREGASAKALRTIALASIQGLVPGPRCHVPFPTPTLESCFGIDTSINAGGRIFFVCADTPAEAQRWKVHLWAAMMQHSAEPLRMAAAQDLAGFIRASPECVEAVVECGALGLFQTHASAGGPWQSLYAAVLQDIGAATKVQCVFGYLLCFINGPNPSPWARRPAWTRCLSLSRGHHPPPPSPPPPPPHLCLSSRRCLFCLRSRPCQQPKRRRLRSERFPRGLQDTAWGS